MEKSKFIAFVNSIEHKHSKKYNIFTAYMEMFKKYAQFKGRSRRSEYWWAMLAHGLIITFLEALSAVLIYLDKTYSDTVAVVLLFITVPTLCVYMLASAIPFLALGVRRLHDTGKSGWYILICLIPGYGIFFWVIFMLTDGELITNIYGENPKGFKHLDIPDEYLERLKKYSTQFIPINLRDIESHEKMIERISMLVPVINVKAMPPEILTTENPTVDDKLLISIAFYINEYLSSEYVINHLYKWKKLSDEALMSVYIYLEFYNYFLGEYSCNNIKAAQKLIALVLINHGIGFVSAETNNTASEQSSDMPI